VAWAEAKWTTAHLNDNEPMISVSTSTTSSTLTCDGRQTARNSCVVCRAINSRGCNKYSSVPPSVTLLTPVTPVTPVTLATLATYSRYGCVISAPRLQLSQHHPPPHSAILLPRHIFILDFIGFCSRNRLNFIGLLFVIFVLFARCCCFWLTHPNQVNYQNAAALFSFD